MQDGRDDDKREGDDEAWAGITLLRVNQAYWLYEGEEYLDAMLLGDGNFPVPVRCVVFSNILELRILLGEGTEMTDFWGINPDIVDRLRRNEQLDEIGAL